MSEIKYSPDLFMGTHELNRMKKFFDDDGFRLFLLKSSKSFGIVRAPNDPNFASYKVTAGLVAGNIRIQGESFAINSLGQVIYYNEPAAEITLPADSKWYAMKIAYKTSTKEVGTVSIGANGALTGTGTEFTNLLRGQPDFPSKIAFLNSVGNLVNYTVVEVINDTSALLAGTFVPEVNLEYAVVGTFTAGSTPSVANQQIFRYDSCLITMVDESVAPVDGFGNIIKATDEYWIARARYDGVTVRINDLREEIWMTTGEYRTNSLIHMLDGGDSIITNPLIGVEGIRWDNLNATRSHNILDLSWGFRSDNWTVNTETRTLTLLGGSGGMYKDTSQFVDTDFDGWRVYAVDGTYQIVMGSALAGGQINLVMTALDTNDYTAGDMLLVVPDVDNVQIHHKGDGAIDEVSHVENILTFPVNIQLAHLWLLVPTTTTYSYNIKYRYLMGSVSTEWDLLPTDVVNGYYDESSYDGDSASATPDGVLNSLPIDRSQVTYTQHATNGYILLTAHVRSYKNIINRLDLGDIKGVNHYSLSNGTPLLELEVGTSKQTQYAEGSIALSVDHYINLKSLNAVEGNEFYLFFKNSITLGAFTLKIVENYVNPATWDLLYDVKALDTALMDASAGLYIKCVFDGTNWLATGYLERLAGFDSHVWDRQYGITDTDVALFTTIV